ncbi:Rrf2 family transcriptional regulator [bacterium]|nr:Rrf2 family transcriptional regulator [bacterium]
MKISTKSRYGIRALYDLAVHQADGPVQLRDIAKRQNISEKYLEQLMARLKTHGLLNSVRGPHGGYLLAKPASSIKIIEIFEILEGPIEPVPCNAAHFHCQNTSLCAANDLWEKLLSSVRDILESTTLADMAALHQNKQSQWTNMYHI